VSYEEWLELMAASTVGAPEQPCSSRQPYKALGRIRYALV